MNIEEYKKYVKNIGKNIENKLGKDSEEFDFFAYLVQRFNQECKERNKLEQVLDEIEKWLKTKADRNNLDDLLQIIKKAKGEINYE